MSTAALQPTSTAADISTEQSLGELARTIPGATRVFHAHQLDFCCGGKKSLQAAADQAGLDALAIARELAALPAQPDAMVACAEASTPDLIDFILNRFHAGHRADLPELIRLARKVESVHGDRPECPLGLADHLEHMLDALERHMQKEEQILFPMLLAGHAAGAAAPIQVMRMEHDQHGEELARLKALTHDITLPKGACNTWRALYLGLQHLRDELMAHIHLENNVLFDRR